MRPRWGPTHPVIGDALWKALHCEAVGESRAGCSHLSLHPRYCVRWWAISASSDPANGLYGRQDRDSDDGRSYCLLG